MITDGELLEAAAERTAILIVALRRLAWAHHRTHKRLGGVTWANCTEEWCRYAHDAIDGKFTIGTMRDDRDLVASITRKEEAS